MTTPISSLLPHAPPMLLLDELVECGIDAVTATATIRGDHPFFDTEAGGVPCHVGIELMAQACGAFAGLRALAEGKPPALGFLLGTRNYRCSVRWFREGDQLKVISTAVYIDGGTGVFDCQILMGSSAIGTARLTVHQPDDPKAVILLPGQ
ncbi:MAG: hypothetical protein WCJ64_02780 [Rhodospirillaceae bacterium]